MSMSKRDFLQEKVRNCIKFLESIEALHRNRKFIEELKKESMEAISVWIQTDLCPLLTEDDYTNYLYDLLDKYHLTPDDLEDEEEEKFIRYLKCFSAILKP